MRMNRLEKQKITDKIDELLLDGELNTEEIAAACGMSFSFVYSYIREGWVRDKEGDITPKQLLEIAESVNFSIKKTAAATGFSYGKTHYRLSQLVDLKEKRAERQKVLDDAIRKYQRKELKLREAIAAGGKSMNSFYTRMKELSKEESE